MLMIQSDNVNEINNTHDMKNEWPNIWSIIWYLSLYMLLVLVLCLDCIDNMYIYMLICFHILFIFFSRYRLSRIEESRFPFAIVSVRMTKVCIEAMREGFLIREINRERSVFQVTSEFHAATLYAFYNIWKQGKTISDFNDVFCFWWFFFSLFSLFVNFFNFFFSSIITKIRK